MKTDNVYAPPATNSQPATIEYGSRLKAVAIGLAIDIGGSLLTGILLSIVYGVILAASGVGEKEAMEQLTHISPTSLPFLIGATFGTMFSWLGAYVCARIAKREEFKLALILGLISVAFGTWVGWESYSVSITLVMTAIAIAAIALGAYMGRARNVADVVAMTAVAKP